MTDHMLTDSLQTLTERVQARVDAARVVVDRRTNAGAPTPQRRARPASTGSPMVEETRESKSLRRVFRELGVSYRRYRSQTGHAVVPGLRDAAYNFRAEPSLTSLVAVAGYLDGLDLLS
jgi:hypothetical protein